jgi:formylglycine-generating enzyme
VRSFALLLIGITVLAASAVADARTLGIVPKVMLRARKAPKLAAGAKGTLARAIADQDKKRKWKRPQTEGTLPEIDPDGSCPPEMGNVDGRFCADRWEASLEVLEGDRAERWSPTLALDPTKKYRAITLKDVVPQGYISGEQAEAACRVANKRLCQPAEWRLACSGGEGTTYPYGPSLVAGRCNDHGHAPMYVFYPEVERSWALVTNADMNDPRLNAMEGTVAKTGAHAGCTNEWGLHDMVGNLHEWVADPYGTFQGGYYLDTMKNGEGCAYRTTAHDVDYHDYSTGFRCCADLHPSPEEE